MEDQKKSSLDNNRLSKESNVVVPHQTMQVPDNLIIISTVISLSSE